MDSLELWKRYRQFFCHVDSLDLSLDISRMHFDEAFLASMETAMQEAFKDMDALESGAIANPDEKRMVGHYWLRAPQLAPTKQIALEISGTVESIQKFAAGVHAGKIKPPMAERFGRRVTLGLYFICMMFSIAIGFGYIFYLPRNALPFFLVSLLFLGLGGANFAMYTLWLPEQYPTECRGSAFAFATSVGRFLGAGFTFLVGAGVAHFHTIGTPVALTAMAFALGLLVLPFGHETTGQTLPA